MKMNVNTANKANVVTQSLDDKIKDLNAKRKEAASQERYEDAAKYRDEISELEAKRDGKTVGKIKTKLTDYTKEERAKLPPEQLRKLVEADLKERKTTQTAQKKITTTQNEQIAAQKKMLMETKETIINRDYLEHKELKNTYNLLQKYKEDTSNYPKNVVNYAICMMERWEWGKIWASLRRRLVNQDAGSFITSKAWWMNVENLKGQMKVFIDKYQTKKTDPQTKTKLYKDFIYDEVKTATNSMLEGIVESNRL